MFQIRVARQLASMEVRRPEFAAQVQRECVGGDRARPVYQHHCRCGQASLITPAGGVRVGQRQAREADNGVTKNCLILFHGDVVDSLLSSSNSFFASVRIVPVININALLFQQLVHR